MKKRYTIEDITRFFEQFKQLPEYYELEKVHSLIHNPGATTRLKDSTSFVRLKYFIFTGAFMLSVLVLYLVSATKTANTPVSDQPIASQSMASPGKTPEVSSAVSLNKPSGSQKQNKPPKMAAVMVVAAAMSKDTTPSGTVDKKESVSSSVTGNTDCSWPSDTVIDKHRLFVYLTNDELQKLGVFIEKNSLYYYNKGGGTMSYFINSRINAERFTKYKFNLIYISDTACTSFPWGHEFYNRIDILVPVVTKLGNTLKILWFSSRDSLFVALPERYRSLKSTYANLKCAKKRNPDHQFVNYWNVKRSAILDSIHYLTLTTEELQNIGVGISKDHISLVDSSETYHYNLGPNGSSRWTSFKKGAKRPETPGKFPVMITDVKGLNMASFGSWVRKQKQPNNQYASAVFNTLIPVKLPVSDIIGKRKYTLILWYYSTDEFLKALPERYRNDIKSEVASISSGEKSAPTTSTYLEASKSTMAINDLKVYPNPATIRATLEFTLSANATGKVSLVNIAGSELRVLVPKTTFMTGFNSFELNLDQIIPGIYIVSIITDKGFKTQRIIISH